MRDINSPERCEARREMFGGVRTGQVRESLSVSGHQFFVTLMIPLFQIVGTLFFINHGGGRSLLWLLGIFTVGIVADIGGIASAEEVRSEGLYRLNKILLFLKIAALPLLFIVLYASGLVHFIIEFLKIIYVCISQ